MCKENSLLLVVDIGHGVGRYTSFGISTQDGSMSSSSAYVGARTSPMLNTQSLKLIISPLIVTGGTSDSMHMFYKSWKIMQSRHR